ncbi:MAG: hypothetical protein QN164_10315 [Armatimonadota bacterium]|nr:hypothetical protein [Armatimonadota bacterium]
MSGQESLSATLSTKSGQAQRFAESVQALTTLRAEVEILPPGALGQVDRVLVDERRRD